MPVRAKICGLSTAETVDAAVAGDASHLGFNFFAKSPRYVDPDQAAALVKRAPAAIAKVAVLVDPDDALVANVVGAGMTALQLHGAETPERMASLRRSCSALQDRPRPTSRACIRPIRWVLVWSPSMS